MIYSVSIMIKPSILSGQTEFTDEMLDITIIVLIDFVPVLIVAIAHFTSYSSVGRLLKIVKTLRLQEMTMDVDDNDYDDVEGPVV